jgi:hypothetical protein
MPKEVQLDNLISCGCLVPAIGKLICLRHYYKIKKLYGEDVRVGQYDTDSWHNMVYKHNIYDDIVKSI